MVLLPENIGLHSYHLPEVVTCLSPRDTSLPFLLVGFSVGFGGISEDSVGLGGIFG